MHMEAWIQGRYMMDAIAAVLDGRKNPYPEEPYIETEKRESAFEQDELAAIEFGHFAKAIGENLKRKGVESNVL